MSDQYNTYSKFIIQKFSSILESDITDDQLKIITIAYECGILDTIKIFEAEGIIKSIKII